MCVCEYRVDKGGWMGDEGRYTVQRLYEISERFTSD